MRINTDVNSLFNFFKILDDDEAYQELVKCLVIEACDEFQSLVTNYDFQTGTVETEIYESGNPTLLKGVYSAKDDIIIRITKVTRDIINEIDLVLLKALQEGQDQKVYLMNYDNILIALANRKYLGFNRKDILHTVFSDISNHMKENYNFISKFNFSKAHEVKSSVDYHPLSYRWKYVDRHTSIITLKKLYNLLTIQPKIIECSEEDFINAFTEGKVVEGINWCAMGKNGLYSKQSLLTFVEYLIANNFIEGKTHDFNQSIIYVFRDNKGQMINNISVSKSSSTKKPSEWDRILSILEKF